MIIRLARLLPLFAVLLIVSCFSAQAEEPLPDRPDVSSVQPIDIDLDVEALPPKGPPKLESSLWQLVEAERRGGEAELSAEAQHSGIALHDGAIRVIIVAKDGRAASAIASARSLGAILETSYGDLVQVVVPVATLERLADDASVRFVRQPYRLVPAVTGEGVGLVNADDWQAAGVTGSGVKVAVLDLGFQGYTSLLGTELPASVTAQSFREDHDITGGGEVHGTAVAEIVHEVAPAAQMYLVNLETDVEFLQAVDWLIGQDVDIVNFSAGWKTIGPGDGTGDINDKVSEAVSSGIVWSNAAGNEAEDHWTGMWSDPDADGWLNFSGTDESNAVLLYEGEALLVAMKWADTWPGCNDYDLLVVDSSSNLVTSSTNVQDCFSADPVEIIGFIAPYDDVFHVLIGKWAATGTPRFHFFWDLYLLYLPPRNLQYVEASRSLCIPADNANAVSVGAVPWSSPNTIESFSSQGPTEDGRTKPDLVAPDRVSGASYGPTAFGGTSAASPHVAGAAALVKQAHPSYSPAQIKSFLEGRAVDLGAGGKDNVYGSGRLDLRSPPPPDSDGDGVADESDNCAYVVNPLQENHDDDGAGDACDCDDDNGGTPDNQEARDGTNPLNPGDDQPLDTADSDGDGALNWEEDWCGTDPFDPCGDDCDPYPPYGTDDAWAYDINMDCWANATDILMFPANVNMPAQLGVHPSYRCRYDLDGNNWVNATDILMFPARVPAPGMPLECTNP